MIDARQGVVYQTRSTLWQCAGWGAGLVLLGLMVTVRAWPRSGGGGGAWAGNYWWTVAGGLTLTAGVALLLVPVVAWGSVLGRSLRD